jgi:hypothetical protein
MFEQGFTCPALLEDPCPPLPVRGCHPLWPAFPDGSGSCTEATGLVRVRSPLLAESLLMSFPPATEMFQFAGFASSSYGFTEGYRFRGGLPHSDIPGSTSARLSPGLFAACHVLHRLSVPRHPPDALLLQSSPTSNPRRAQAPRAVREHRRCLRAGARIPMSKRRQSRRPELAPGPACLAPCGHDSLCTMSKLPMSDDRCPMRRHPQRTPSSFLTSDLCHPSSARHSDAGTQMPDAKRPPRPNGGPGPI